MNDYRKEPAVTLESMRSSMPKRKPECWITIVMDGNDKVVAVGRGSDPYSAERDTLREVVMRSLLVEIAGSNDPEDQAWPMSRMASIMVATGNDQHDVVKDVCEHYGIVAVTHPVDNHRVTFVKPLTEDSAFLRHCDTPLAKIERRPAGSPEWNPMDDAI